MEIEPGRVTESAGKCAYLALQRSTDDLKKGFIDAVVTAPINKANIQRPEFQYTGHTEYYKDKFDADTNLMLMCSENLRVGLLTGHMPLERVKKNITRENIIAKVKLLAQSLKEDFNILKPRIAVLGVNPHAGEEGLLGDEESKVMGPTISELHKKGILVFGPYPADGFFGTMLYRKFDGVLAAYHDQGLVPFKTIAFESGVNFTAGLSIVRTSPDHGTAYNIAGKGIANETSMREAIFTAIDIFKNRDGKIERQIRVNKNVAENNPTETGQKKAPATEEAKEQKLS